MEYVTDQLIERVFEEISNQKLALFRNHALLKVQGKDYIQDIQARLILKPVGDRLLNMLRSKRMVKEQLTKTLAMLRDTAPLEPGYTGGNTLNLLCQLKLDLTQQDFSELTIWQADLRDVELHQVNFHNADLAKSIFTRTSSGIASVAFNSDGKTLATSDTSGEICLWQGTEAHECLWSYRGHTGCVFSVAFSPDGCTLASGGNDCTVRLWDVKSGECLKTLQGHSNALQSL